MQLRFLIGLRHESLENDIAATPKQPQNVNECITACQNYPPETCETSPLPDPISTSSSTWSAGLCPDQQCAKWGAGGFPPKGYSIRTLQAQALFGETEHLNNKAENCLAILENVKKLKQCKAIVTCSYQGICESQYFQTSDSCSSTRCFMLFNQQMRAS